MGATGRGGIRMKILNLFAGIGGNRSLWKGHEITAIEFNEQIAAIYQKRFLDDVVIVEDAFSFLEQYFAEFDFIWASPPCQTHSRLNMFPNHIPKLPDMRLYALIIFLKQYFKKPWVVENVVPFYTPLIPATVQYERHLFWSNISLQPKHFKYERVDYNDMTVEDLCLYHDIDRSIIPNIKNWANHDLIRQILRNCCHREIGAYILQQSQIKKWY